MRIELEIYCRVAIATRNDNLENSATSASLR